MAPTRCVRLDFNGDGKDDVATVNPADGTVSVLLGDGAGHLSPIGPFAAGVDPEAIAVATLNADALPDIIVVNTTANTVSVLLNVGGTSLAAAVPYATATGPVSLVTGNFNGTGGADVVVVCQGQPRAQVFTGNGDGTLTPPAAFIPLPQPAIDVAAADVDGDGDLDLAVLTNAATQVFKNDGSGGFSLSSNLSATPSMRRIGFAAVTTPAGIDLVVTNQGLDRFIAYPNDGAGGFSELTAATTETGDGPTGFALADVDGDTRLDMIVACTNTGEVKVHLGNGDGTFAAPSTETVGAGADTAVVGVFGPSGKQGIAVSETTAKDVYLLVHN